MALTFSCDVCSDHYDVESNNTGGFSYMTGDGKIHHIKGSDTPCHNCRKRIFDAAEETKKLIREEKKKI